MHYQFKPRGVCTQNIEIELDGTIIRDIKFIGGCSGNTQGVAALVIGEDAKQVIPKLKGIRCGMRPSSCPDQLAKALEEALAQK